jgi:4'-phosphopantetheinyl transferase
MTVLGWLAIDADAVPGGDAWLTAEERGTQGGLRFERRRRDWRLGRYVAKQAVSAALGVPVHAVGIRAAPDGAPEAFVDGRPAGASVSISHRAGRGLAVVDLGGHPVGGDVEVVEPRSDGFVADWCTAAELTRPTELTGDRDRLVTLLWSAKEATSKVRREGLRLDLRRVVVTLCAVPDDDGWYPWTAAVAAPATGSPATAGPDTVGGWWRQDRRCLLTVATPAPTSPPRCLAGSTLAGTAGG